MASLAACSTPAETAVACEATPSGAASDAVKVTGDFGSKPEVTIDAPTEAEKTERTVVIKGDGDTAVAGDTVNVEFTLFNGTTGDELTSTEYGETPTTAFPVDEEQFLVGIVKTMECSQVGSRVVGVIPPDDSFGGAGSADLGVAADEDIVFVVDIVSIEPPVEPLEPKAWTENVPEVDLTPDIPVVTLPSTDASPDYLLKVLEEGDGATVAAGDTVQLNYQGTSWQTGEIFDQSFGREPASFSTDQVIEGFGSALIGQKVGTTLIVSIPPEYAYGTDPEAAELGGQTLVFLIEILGVG